MRGRSAGRARPVSRAGSRSRSRTASSGAFVVIDPTPAAMSRRISSSSSTVHGCTDSPAVAAAARSAGAMRSRRGPIASTGGKIGAGWPGAGSATG